MSKLLDTLKNDYQAAKEKDLAGAKEYLQEVLTKVAESAKEGKSSVTIKDFKKEYKGTVISGLRSEGLNVILTGSTLTVFGWSEQSLFNESEERVLLDTVNSLVERAYRDVEKAWTRRIWRW